ncbi:MAG: hypothetical protein R3F14_16360 [Polyangiaceae bacterium]
MAAGAAEGSSVAAGAGEGASSAPARWSWGGARTGSERCAARAGAFLAAAASSGELERAPA